MALQQGLVTITGRVGSNPQGHGNSSPPTICTFRLGCTRGYYDANRQWRSLPTTWLTVKSFRSLAANVHASVRVGEPIIVTGVLATEEWASENGEARSRNVLEASHIGHDLNYGTTRLNNGRKDASGAGTASGGENNATGRTGAEINVASGNNSSNATSSTMAVGANATGAVIDVGAGAVSGRDGDCDMAPGNVDGNASAIPPSMEAGPAEEPLAEDFNGEAF